MFDFTFKDIFSANNENYKFFTLYNRQTRLREACILVSAGIDGKLNCATKEIDTLFIDNFYNKLDFYNDSSFNFYNYFFGRKDYLGQYFNGYEYYKNSAKRLLPANILLERIENYIPDRSIIAYSGIIKYYSKKKKEIISVENELDTIICEMSKLYVFDKKIGDSIAIVCKIDNIDLNNRKYNFYDGISIDFNLDDLKYSNVVSFKKN